MAAVSARRALLPLSLVVAVCMRAQAQNGAPPPSPAGTTAAWTLHIKGDLRWQQVTPAGVLLVSTDAALSGIDIERGQLAWEKPELGGLPLDSVRMVEGSLLMEAARPGLLLVFDPVTGAVVFDSRRLNLAQIVTRRVLPQSGTLLVHGRRAAGPPVVALYDLVTGDQQWVSESLFQTEPRKRGLGGIMQGLARTASEGTALEVLQAGPDMIVVETLLGLRGLDARTGAVRWVATLPTARGNAARHVRLYPALDKPDRIYVSFDDRLMAYRLADGQPLWAKPATVEGWVHDIVQHPNGIIILPESPPANQATGNVRIVNGVVQTGLNVARYEDGTTIAAQPLRMRGTVKQALVAGGSVVLAVDAESRTFVNVLEVATATVRLNKDVKIKGQLAYAELTPAGLLYISRPDPATNAEVNIIDLTTGEQKFKDAIESGRPWGGNPEDYNAAGYSLHHVVEGSTLYVFASHDHRLYAIDRNAGTYRALGGEIKLQGDEDPTAMEIRAAGLVLISPQNLVVVGRDGQVKQQVYYPAPKLPGLLRALHAINAVRAGLYGAVASAYGDAFAQMSRNATDSTARRLTGQMATVYTQGGAHLAGYSRQSAALATKRFRASLTVPGSVFMLTHAPDGDGNVLLQIDKDTGQPHSRVDLGKEREPVYAVDDVAGMLFLRTAAGTLVGYRL